MSTPNESKIGKEFALKVAQRLKLGDLTYTHRDYCGTGLTLYKGEYLYCRVYDGYPGDTIRSFSSEEEFVEWLAEQSDRSLAGYDEEDAFYRNNQRITRARLYDFINTKPGPM